MGGGLVVLEKQRLTVALIGIFLTPNGVEHLFTCLSIICVSSLEKCLFRAFAHFWIGLSFCYQIIMVLRMFWIEALYQVFGLQIFSAIPLSATFCSSSSFFAAPLQPRSQSILLKRQSYLFIHSISLFKMLVWPNHSPDLKIGIRWWTLLTSHHSWDQFRTLSLVSVRPHTRSAPPACFSDPSPSLTLATPGHTEGEQRWSSSLLGPLSIGRAVILKLLTL